MDSVGNALRTLNFLGVRTSVTVTELSRHLAVAPSTAHRLLATLVEFGFATQGAPNRPYMLGPAVYDIAMTRLPPDLIATARPPMEDLLNATQETVNLLVLQGPDAVFLDGIEGGRTVRVAIRTGDRLPAYTTAGGKALLSHQPRDYVRSMFPSELVRLTRNTIRTTDQLIDELGAVLSNGYSVNRGESVDGVDAVGAAILHPSRGAIAAVTVSAPASRVDDARLRELAGFVKGAADRVTASWARAR